MCLPAARPRLADLTGIALSFTCLLHCLALPLLLLLALGRWAGGDRGPVPFAEVEKRLASLLQTDGPKGAGSPEEPFWPGGTSPRSATSGSARCCAAG